MEGVSRRMKTRVMLESCKAVRREAYSIVLEGGRVKEYTAAKMKSKGNSGLPC